MKRAGIAILASALCAPTFASIECKNLKVQSLHYSDNQIFVNLGLDVWHSVGQVNDPTIETNLVVLNQALRSGELVDITYDSLSSTEVCDFGHESISISRVFISEN